MRKAISPVIATVILIAITIVIGTAVGGWLLGLWGGFGEVEVVRIYPDAKLEIASNTSAKLSLTLKNEGTRDARIVKVFMEGVPDYCSSKVKVKGPSVIIFLIPISLEESSHNYEFPKGKSTASVRFSSKAGRPAFRAEEGQGLGIFCKILVDRGENSRGGTI